MRPIESSVKKNTTQKFIAKSENSRNEIKIGYKNFNMQKKIIKKLTAQWRNNTRAMADTLTFSYVKVWSKKKYKKDYENKM